MLWRHKDGKRISFLGVAIAFILLGSFCFAVGMVEWLFNYYAQFGFFLPILKGFGGLMLLGFGYIILELELMRLEKNAHGADR
jgi:hypothetical protein